MKKLTKHTLYTIVITTLVILSVLISIMSGLSIAFNSNVYLLGILFTAAIAVVVVLLLIGILKTSSGDTKKTEDTDIDVPEKEQVLAQKDKQIAEMKKQVEELKLQISRLSRPAEGQPSELEKLQKKCETIEAFRNSFPYQIANDYILYNVIRTELVVSAYSRWQLVGEHKGNLWAYSLLRPDTQSHKEMLSLAVATQAPQELEELNFANQLMWH